MLSDEIKKEINYLENKKNQGDILCKIKQEHLLFYLSQIEAQETLIKELLDIIDNCESRTDFYDTFNKEEISKYNIIIQQAKEMINEISNNKTN